jgi:hypothetical protein
MMKFASFERVVEYIYSTLPKPKHEYGKLVQTEVLTLPLEWIPLFSRKKMRVLMLG